MLQGFKQFMLRGNVLDLAVAIEPGFWPKSAIGLGGAPQLESAADRA